MTTEDHPMASTKDQVTNTGEEVATKAKEDAATLAEKAGEVVKEVSGHAGQLAEQSRDAYKQVAKHTQKGIRQAGAVVRANPGLSLTAAFGVGVTLGILVGMTMRPSRRNDFSSHFRRPSWLS
jgi:ElaB/YqjD/DUF883 family membrane-anchored ribosome-binding protein